MNDLTSLPSSVRAHLERAQTLIEQNRGTEAQIAFREAAVTLATTNPELSGLLMAAHLGYTGVTITQTDERSDTTRNGRYAFGVRYGEDVTRVNRSHTLRRTIEFNNRRFY